ncbi:restriction endonuclease [Pseudomonas sp. LABIM340]|uniref:nSTAND3 domain-containing NTPase n=1 Tax=Pseudomonas sp. LABIM340 TaxID=3156585 RepID=UPI0032AE8B1E
MSDYDFSSLNDKDFEMLVTDLLSVHLGVRIERFKAGKDLGVDGRYFSQSGGEVIVQCKHWIKSGVPALIKQLEDKECAKVSLLKPKSYILVTSLGLSRANKIKIKNALSPFVKSESDIYGAEDLNQLLSTHGDVERRHYKLWITSTRVLQAVLNSAIIGRSKFKAEEIISESAMYVVTEGHEKAIEKLESLHSVVITGAPGVGKTFLADQLCQFYAAKNYELYFIENSLSEAEAAYDDSLQQVFYFDDFLGRNFLLALKSHEDSQLVSFIRRVERDPKKRFILTSRTTILNQGKRLSDLFDINKIERREFEVSMTDLGDLDKAKIFYNHIWFSDLREGYIEEIYKDKRYIDVIRHANFNPRLISFITDLQRVEDIGTASYWDYIERTLSNPKEIWRNVFDVQVDSTCRLLVIAVALHGRALSEQSLESGFYRLKERGVIHDDGRDFEALTRLLVGALLNRTIRGDRDAHYDLFNPSIGDYVVGNCLGDALSLANIFISVKSSGFIDNLRSLRSSGSISSKKCEDILFYVLAEDLSSGDESRGAFFERAVGLSAELKPQSERLLNVMSDICERERINVFPMFSEGYLKFICFCLEAEFISRDDQVLIGVVQEWVSSDGFGYDEIALISDIVRLLNLGDEEVGDLFQDMVVNVLVENITDEVIQEGILSEVYSSYDYFRSDLISFVEGQCERMGVSLSQDRIYEVIDGLDIDRVVSSNVDAEVEGKGESGEYFVREPEIDSEKSIDFQIDDIFERG